MGQEFLGQLVTYKVGCQFFSGVVVGFSPRDNDFLVTCNAAVGCLPGNDLRHEVFYTWDVFSTEGFEDEDTVFLPSSCLQVWESRFPGHSLVWVFPEDIVAQSGLTV